MFERFRTRSYQLERIDTGDHTRAEYERWQREMPWIHGFFGEVRALEASLLPEIRRTSSSHVSILDIGAGAGTLLNTVRAKLGTRSSFLVGAEINADAAASLAASGSHAVRCDGLQLPFADGAFDHAFSTLMLHHLGNEEAVTLLSEMGRVSRGRIFMVDLNRSAVAYYAYRAFAPIVLQRLTVDDGALSILRSFTREELYELASRAGLNDVTVKDSRLNRLILSGTRR